ncbi:hypothetical protein TNCV_4254311 [Trichonephila clavipes]|nr:hypothetical protein TNCV_4254311 [Trichonephila clavipes]
MATGSYMTPIYSRSQTLLKFTVPNVAGYLKETKKDRTLSNTSRSIGAPVFSSMRRLTETPETAMASSVIAQHRVHVQTGGLLE